MIVSYLEEDIQRDLRSRGLITENEVVTKQGDLYIAVNVVDNTKRVVNIDMAYLNESAKRILRG
tara:strand:+ start:293 stop:484 length:192 start_codon:yes stop_codon:yes gene_type:complete